MPSLRAQLARLQQLLLEAGLEPGKLRHRVAARHGRGKARKDAVGRAFGQEHHDPRRSAAPEGHDQHATQGVTRLNREVIQRGSENKAWSRRRRGRRASGRPSGDESLRLDRERGYCATAQGPFPVRGGALAALCLDGAKARNVAEGEAYERIAEKNTLSKPIAAFSCVPAQEIPAQKETIKSQSLEIRRLRRAVRASAQGSRYAQLAPRVEVSVGPGRGTAHGAAEIATPEGHHQVAARGQRPAAQGREDVARVETLEAELAKLLTRCFEDALRAQEREAGDAAHRAPGGQQRGAPGHGRAARA